MVSCGNDEGRVIANVLGLDGTEYCQVTSGDVSDDVTGESRSSMSRETSEVTNAPQSSRVTALECGSGTNAGIHWQ